MKLQKHTKTFRIVSISILLMLTFTLSGNPSNANAASDSLAYLLPKSLSNNDANPILPTETGPNLDWSTFLKMVGTGQDDVQALAGNPSLNWNTFLGSSGFDSGVAVTLDGIGNIYITGRSDDKWGAPILNPAGGGDVFVAKLNSSGTLQWNTFLGGTAIDAGDSIAVDGSGNVLIAGRSDATWGTPVNAHAGNQDAFVAKLNSSGALQWNTFLGSAGVDSNIGGFKVDVGGNAFVAGYSEGTWGTPVNAHAGNRDAFVAKLNDSGVLQWNTFLGSAGDEYGDSIALDGSGNIFIGGNGSATWGTPINAFAGDHDAFVAKLNSSGALQWNTFLGSSGYDWGGGIALDSSGNIFAVGESDTTWGSPVTAFGGGGWDAYAAKLNSSGVLQWNTFLGGAGDDYTFNGDNVSVDSSGNLYMTGGSSATWGTPVVAFAGTNTTNAFTAKLNTNGVRQWNTFLGADSNGYAVAVDGSGNSHIIGSSWSDWGSTPVNDFTSGQEAFVVKLNSSGVRQWNTFLGASGFDGGFGITSDTNGNVYITGYSFGSWGTPVNAHSGGSSDIFVAKLNSSGELQWNTFLGASGYDYSSAIALDGSGNVYITGYSYGSWGSPMNAYSGSADITVAKLNNSGVLQWNTFLGSATGWEASWDLALDDSGNVYITGEGDTNWGSPVNAYAGGGYEDSLVAKLNNSGVLQWHTFQGSEWSDWGDYLAVDSSGNLYVNGTAGYTWGSPINAWASYFDAFLAKFNNSGALQWHTYMGTASGDDYGGGLALDGSGNIFVGGSSEYTWGSPLNAFSGTYDGFVSKLNSSGVRQWNTFLGGAGDDNVYDLGLDSAGNIYLTGDSSATWGTPAYAYSGDYDAFVAKLSSSGIPQWNTFLGSIWYDLSFALAVSNNSIYIIGYSWDEWGTPINQYSGAADAFVAKLNNPTFADVSADHWAWQYIESIYNAGVTGGCGTSPLIYCPTNAVTRAQMAVFLLKAEHGSAYVPPAATGVFSDVPTSFWAADWIEQLATEGITGGCGGSNYCPNNPVNRAQMAVFLLKAEHGSAYVPPAATGVFSDVPTTHWAADWIEQLANEAITGGCGGSNYCPNTSVNRAQMGVFLQKTFNLPIP